MFENIKKITTNSGWFESPDISGKAPRHFEVSRKRQFENEFPIVKAVKIEPEIEIEETNALHFKIKDETEREKFGDICMKFYELHQEDIDDVGYSIKDCDAIVYVPKSHSDEFTELAKENKFTLTTEK